MKKFEKIVTWIQEEVRSGRMLSGEKLPSEQKLSEQFQVSRQTVRRALEELVKENIVEKMCIRDRYWSLVTSGKTWGIA